MQQTLLCLGRMYRCVDGRIFGGLAQEAVACATAAAQSAARLVAKRVFQGDQGFGDGVNDGVTSRGERTRGCGEERWVCEARVPAVGAFHGGTWAEPCRAVTT